MLSTSVTTVHPNIKLISNPGSLKQNNLDIQSLGKKMNINKTGNEPTNGVSNNIVSIKNIPLFSKSPISSTISDSHTTTSSPSLPPLIGKTSVFHDDLDKIEFPGFKNIFSKESSDEIKIAVIMTTICMIIVIGFTIRKYNKLKKAGQQVKNITNTIFPVRIISLYLYLFLGYPLSVFMQFLTSITPKGYGIYNLIQVIYQSVCYIWLWDLYVEYFGGSEQIVSALRRAGPYMIWKVPPFMLNIGTETYFKANLLIVSYLLILQYLPVNVMLNIISFLYPHYAIYTNIFILISLLISIYGIMLIYWPSKLALQPYQGGWKLGLPIVNNLLYILIDIITRKFVYEALVHHLHDKKVTNIVNAFSLIIYWKLMIVCCISTLSTLAAAAIIDSREIYHIYNLPLPSSQDENKVEKENPALLPK